MTDKHESRSQPQFQNYGFEYRYAGSQWLINVPAENESAARERLAQASIGRCMGTLEATIPANVPGSGWLARVICWWRTR